MLNFARDLKKTWSSNWSFLLVFLIRLDFSKSDLFSLNQNFGLLLEPWPFGTHALHAATSLIGIFRQFIQKGLLN